MLTPEHVAFVGRLLPPDPHWGATGALPLSPDPRDFDMRSIPGVAAVLEAGVPDAADLFQFIRGPSQNQGSLPACVAYSTSNLAAIDGVIEGGGWDLYDAHTLYTEAGGTGSNGVDTRVTLDIAIKQGIPLLGGRRQTIAAYAFAPQEPGTYRQTIKAAVAAGHACTLALLLPTPFSYNSGNARTSGYHQVVVVGYDPEWAIIYNSWGDAWPDISLRNGVGRVRWDFLEADGLQNRYCYAFTTTPFAIPPPPPPPPVTSALIKAFATGPGVGGLRIGDSLRLTSGLVLGVEDVQFNPPPPPTSLAVTSYVPNPVQGGVAFQINGEGFGGGNMTADFQGVPLIAQRLGDTQIQATAPLPSVTATAPVTVRVEGAVATGPPLTVLAGVPPPGQLTVKVVAHRYSAALLGVWAYCYSPSGQPVMATMTGTAGALALDTRVASIGAWTIRGVVGGSVTVNAVAGDQTGTGTAAI